MKLNELQDHWDRFGQVDPLWAILTDPSKKNGRWDLAEFFQTGVEEIQTNLRHAMTLHPVPRRRALDFGCGVGRLTQALGEVFEQADGVDIAPSMVALANQYNRHGDRCDITSTPAMTCACSTMGASASSIPISCSSTCARSTAWRTWASSCEL